LTIAGLPESVREKCLDAKIDSKSTLLGIARQFDEEAMLTYTDELVSGKRPKKAAKEKAEKPPAAASAEKKSSDGGRTFTYSARGFKLNIEFSENAPSGREAVLKALKEAFASVKSQKN
jgi:hypothetical protein